MKLPMPLVPAGLVLLCAVLGADLLYQLAAPPPEIQAPHVASRPQPAAQGTVTPFTPPPLQQFSEIDERPVFNPLRQPVLSPASSEVSMAGTPSDFALVGIIMGTGRRIAVVKTPGTASAQNISVGGVINEWRVTQIEPDYIVIRGNSGEHEVKVPLRSNERAGAQEAQPEQ